MWTNSICRKLSSVNETTNVTLLKEHKGTCMWFSLNLGVMYYLRTLSYKVLLILIQNYMIRVARLNPGTKNLDIMPLRTQFFYSGLSYGSFLFVLILTT